MKQRWLPQELDRFWFLSDDELALLQSINPNNRLAFAVQLKFLEHEGRFPRHRGEIAVTVIELIANQLAVSAVLLRDYDWNGRVARRHRSELRELTGFRPATSQDAEQLKAYLLRAVAPKESTRAGVSEVALSWCRRHRIEPPTPGRLDRIIGSALRQFEAALFGDIAAALSTPTRAKLDQLLAPLGGDRSLPLFADLKADPGRPSVETVRKEFDKLKAIDRLGLPHTAFETIPRKTLAGYRARAATEPPSELKDRVDASRYALVSIYCWVRRREITDDLVELPIRLVHHISVRAERKVVQELIRDIRKVHGKTTLLYKLAEAAVEHPDGIVRDVLFPVIGERTLEDLVEEYRSTGPAYLKKIHTVVRASYSGHYRRMLPLILETLEFRSNNTVHRPVIKAIELIHQHRESRQHYFTLEEAPIEGVLRKNMREIVIETDSHGVERVNRINYEIAVLGALRTKLRCKEIWVVGAKRFRNPDEDLPQDYDDNRAEYYRPLDLPQRYDDFGGRLRKEMESALAALNDTLPKNPKVRLSETAKHPILVTPLEAQPEPSNLVRLKSEIALRWPDTGLLDVLKEADLRIGFTECFQTTATRQAIDQSELQRRLLLCLYGLGTNAGLKRVSARRLGVTYKELLYTRRRFIQKASLRQAIATVADAIFAARLPAIWGEGTTACASDSKKFGSWDQNLMTEWHIRYGGRGIMIYWHVEKKATCIYSQLKRCSSSEVASMIEGVLRHCTDMAIERQYVDSHGQSEVGFAFCYLIGFDLLPRLKAINSQKLYVPGPNAKASYPNLLAILTRPINWALLEQQYDEMVKYATALKEGTADPEAILQRFTRSNVQHPTYQALSELGKAIKTIFLCKYLQSETLRREIHEGLNVVENWNSTNSFIFFGKGGEVASNRLEEQELSVLSLHLLQICLVYVNTLMIQSVLGDRAWSDELAPEDLRALSPLIYSHVNPYGIFELDMEQRIPFGIRIAA